MERFQSITPANMKNISKQMATSNPFMPPVKSILRRRSLDAMLSFLLMHEMGFGN